ncbi:NADP-dependent oxidoreductase [Kineococcus sp. GCM10028916]|uniref:NADP-dependent oxidoreductase n=1 Tax=Kineococcus sp. GCM10028916 TaxID=3273394 RepID=UPI00363BA931
MKAIRLHEHGGPEVLRLDDVAVPAIGPGEVLVRVHAVGINPPDGYVRDGMTILPPELRPTFSLPIVPGTDVSGVVVALAPDVERFTVGDEVFGMLRFPRAEGAAYAEFVAAPAHDLARKPAALDHVHAAGAPMALLTAWQHLVDPGHDGGSPFQAHPHRPVPLGAGSRVLVNGAGGGVGHLAVQVAKWKGAHVVAAASARHESFLAELGADEFLDYAVQPPEEVVRDVDLVLDTVGGPRTGRFLRSVKRGGALFPVFFGPCDADLAAELGVTVSGTQVRSSGTQLAEIAPLLQDGTIRIAVESTFPLAHAAQAHERAAQGHLQGKLVLTIG